MRILEDTVKDERGPLHRGESFEGDQERQAERFRINLAGGSYRLRKPRADVRLAPRSGGGQAVDAEPTDGRGQERPFVSNVGVVGRLPAQPSVLYGVLRVRRGAEHAVGNAQQHGAVAFECLNLHARLLCLRTHEYPRGMGHPNRSQSARTSMRSFSWGA